MIKFEGIIREVKARVSASNDKVFRVVIEAENPMILEAGSWPADETVDVIIERHTNKT